VYDVLSSRNQNKVKLLFLFHFHIYCVLLFCSSAVVFDCRAKSIYFAFWRNIHRLYTTTDKFSHSYICFAIEILP